MSAQCVMYEIRPLYERPKITEIPKCMYEMTSLHSETKYPVVESFIQEKFPPIDKNDPNNKALIQLEERQKRLITQLEELTIKLQQIKQQMTLVPATPMESTDEQDVKTSSHQLTSGLVTDVVIAVSPHHNLVGFLTLLNWLKEKYRVALSCHIHSSLKKVKVPSVVKLQSETSNKADLRSNQQLIITLIWKDVGPDPLLIVSPLKQGPISGEVNVLRYLSYFLSQPYQVTDPIKKTEVDSWLDIAHVALTHGNNQERQTALDTLESHLNQRKYLVGDKLTIADIGVLAAILKVQSTQSLKGSALKKWVKVCLENPGLSSTCKTLSITL